MTDSKPRAGYFSILYFAAASSFTKKQQEYLAAPLPVSSLFDELEKRYPGIKEKVLSSSALTVNLEYVDFDGTPDAMIQERDEVAIIPPVSSG